MLNGIDLSGALAVVTGGYSGIGIETVRALVGAGAEVVVPARRREHAERELNGIDRVTVIELDLGDLESVRAAAQRLLDADRRIEILINNAAIMATPETRVGPGWEAQFATNHLGHFAFANRLWPLLERGDGARVVALSSSGHRNSGIRFDDLMFERDPYEPSRSGLRTGRRRAPTASSPCSSTRSDRIGACARSRSTRAAS